MTRWPSPSLRHVGRLTDGIGVVEHAELAVPRAELGYCTDDAGRALAVAARMGLDPGAERIARVALSFLHAAHAGGGAFRLRRSLHDGWTGDPSSDDAGGRALFGLGTAAAVAPWPDVRRAAADLFTGAARFRSDHPRATAYAALGAVELLYADPCNRPARELVGDAADLLEALEPVTSPGWRWPAPRLTYANALIPHAQLAVAHTLVRPQMSEDALDLLGWLVDEETRGGWFSFTPVGGRGPRETRPGFDQQPVEAWAMAEACAAAHELTAQPRWADAARRAGRWFLGDNDAGVGMFDSATGGGYDGLVPGGVNVNEGAESSLAFVATMHAVWNVDGVPRLSLVAAGGGFRPEPGADGR